MASASFSKYPFLKWLLMSKMRSLSDMALTLADYAIVLTLSQLDGVETVEIQTSGYLTDYRSHQTLKAEEVMMTDLLAIEYSFS